MTAIIGTVVGSPIVPSDTGDTYPTHYALYGTGGLRSVTNTTQRNAISVDRSEVGMLVYVTDDIKYYILTGLPASNPANWSEFAGSGSYLFANGLYNDSGTVKIGGTISEETFIISTYLFGVDGGLGLKKQVSKPSGTGETDKGYFYSKLISGHVYPFWEDEAGNEYQIAGTSGAYAFSNGLEESPAGQVHIGGTVTSNITLDLDSKSFTLTNGGLTMPWLKIPLSASAPSVIAPTGYGYIYTKAVSGTSQLFYQNSIGTEVQVTGLAAPTVYAFSNGLTESPVGTVKLGGSLNTNTTITRGSFIFKLAGGYTTDWTGYDVSVSKPAGSGVTGRGFLYSKLASGLTQLFYEDSAGTEYQITPLPIAGITFDVGVADGDMVKKSGTTLVKSLFCTNLFYPGPGVPPAPAGYTAPANGDILVKAGDYVAKCTGVSESLIIPIFAASSFTSTAAATNEYGSTVNNFTFNWTYNWDALPSPPSPKDPTTQSITPISGGAWTNPITPTTLRTKIVAGAGLTTPTTYTLSATGPDGTLTALGLTIGFSWKRYWGTWNTTAPTNANILANFSSEFASSYLTGKNFNPSIPSPPRYMFFAYPTSFGLPGRTTMGVVDFSDWTYTTMAFTNASGGSTNYYVLRTNTAYSGTSYTWTLYVS